MYQEKPPVVAMDSDGPLPIAECRRLLRSVPTGRLVYTEDALPAVRPVTFAALDGDLVIPTGNNPWFDRFDRGCSRSRRGPSTRPPAAAGVFWQWAGHGYCPTPTG